MTRIQAAVGILFLCFGTAFLIVACGDGGSAEPTSTPAPTATAGTPFAGLAEGISAILTAGIPTGSPEHAEFVATVLSVGGVAIEEVERMPLSDDDLDAGVQSRATGKAGSAVLTITVYDTPEDAEELRFRINRTPV